jgi:TonB family protein
MNQKNPFICLLIASFLMLSCASPAPKKKNLVNKSTPGKNVLTASDPLPAKMIPTPAGAPTRAPASVETSKSTVPTVIRSMRPQIKECYLTGLKKQIDLKGRVVASFDVNDQGKVVNCGIKQSTLPTSIVDRCICQEILKATFPPSPAGKKVTIVYPFSFSYKD